MVDLRGQYEGLRSEIDAAMGRVMESCSFVRGAEIEEFERVFAAYMGVRHVVAVANGTDALMLAYMSLGLQPGDEVVVPDFTFVATAEAAAHLRLKPVLADVNRDTMTVDPESVRRAITPRTRAIAPVHLFGQNADMDAILAIAREHGLYVVEDAAQSVGSVHIDAGGRRRCSGTVGTVGCTSFFPSKNLGCYGDGGAVLTDDDGMAERVRSLANHGMTERYRYERVGVNSRLDTIQAAVLLAKLPHLDEYIAARRSAAIRYTEALADDGRFVLPVTAGYTTHAFHQYTIRCTGVDRDALRRHLAEAGVPTMVYYPVPLHRHRVYGGVGGGADNFAVADRLAGEVLSLPMHTELDDEQIGYITDRIKDFR